MLENNKLSAWDGVFTSAQIQEIVNMLKHSKQLNFELLSELTANPPKIRCLVRQGSVDIVKSSVKRQDEEEGFVKKPVRKCPQCGGVLKLISVREKESSTYKSKWKCCKTCKSSGCGYTEYSIKDVEQIIAEVKNGAS